MRVTRKILTCVVANSFFLIDFAEIFSFFFSFFCFSWFLFFVVAVVCLLFFEIKNVYSDTHSTMRADE